MVHMQAKFTIERISGVLERPIRFCSYGLSRCCIDQNSRSLNNLGLVGMQNRNIIERSIQRFGSLACHQRHKRLNGAYFNSRANPNRDAN